MGDYAVGSNNTAATDGDTLQNRYSGTDPSAAAYPDRAYVLRVRQAAADAHV